MIKSNFHMNWSNWHFPLSLVAVGLTLMAFLPLLLPNPKAQTGPLLVSTDRQGTIKAERNQTVIRSQNVLVDLEQLRDPQRLRLTVPLFNGDVVLLTRDRVEQTREGGFLWYGKVTGQPGSFVTLSVVGDALVGNIGTQNGERYHLRYLGQGVHSLRQIDQSKYAPEAPPTRPQVTPRDGREADTCATDPPSDIDVMVVYTADARNAAGGTSAMLATIYLAVAETNESYLNSNITQRLRLVHAKEIVYTESGNIQTDRDRLRGNGDGFMDGVHSLRNTYGADLVALITENGGGYCGMSFIMDPVGNAFESYAFAVVARDCATGYYSFGHELGHVMSARHDWYVDSTNNSPYTFNHCFVKKMPTAPATPWRTVMAYNWDCADSGFNCTRVPYFSNPNVNYPVGGDPMGVASGINQADNRQTLNNTALTVANFRCSAPGVTNVWMKDTWNDTGLEPDPATAGDHMWKSPYIWIRKTQDTTLVHQHQHQNPEFGSTNWVYVKLHNGSASAANGNLELYYANASSGLSWPMDWTLLTTVPVSSFTAHSTRIVEAEWSSLPGTGHYCMVARWVSVADPMTNPETSDINANVRNNNNLVWRNLNIVDLVADSKMDASFIVRNSFNVTAPSSLLIRTPPSESNHSFIREGQLFVQFDRSLLDAWRRGGLRGHGFQETREGFLVTNPEGALFENLVLTGLETGQVKMVFKKLPTTSKRQFTVDAIQFDPRRVGTPGTIGGVSYEIHTDENANL